VSEADVSACTPFNRAVSTPEGFPKQASSPSVFGSTLGVTHMDFILPELTVDLTFEQQFQMRLMEEQVGAMNQQQTKELLLQASRLLMMKDNVIRSLVKKVSA
jgi:Phycobilisome degradation protein nblA